MTTPDPFNNGAPLDPLDNLGPRATPELASSDELFEVASDIQKLIESAPPHIWLDLGENLEALTAEGTFRDLKEVTWSEDNATGTGIKYVRAPVLPTLRIDFKQATALLAMFGGEPCEITLRITEGHSGPGLYAHYTEYPEEGCEFLGTPDDEAVPATPAQEMAQAGLGVPGQRVASDAEKKCRDAFENYFHKVAATMTYEQWCTAFKVGFRCGREDCTKDWADHMARIASTIARATKEQP